MRRNLLMSYLTNQYKWLPYSIQYIYHNLIPVELPTVNLWDEEWEVGNISDTTGENTSTSQGRIRSVGYIKVDPSKTYYIKNGSNVRINIFFYGITKNYINFTNKLNETFIVPDNCCYIRFATDNSQNPYTNDITINVSNPAINGIYFPYKPRKVQDKARLFEIEGNSVVVNQYLHNNNFESTGYWGTIAGTTLSISNNIATFTANAQNGQLYQAGVQRIAGHKYLLCCSIKTTTATTSIQLMYAGSVRATSKSTTNWQTLYGIFSDNTTGATFFVINDNRSSGWDAIQVKNVAFIDLTQEFPFDTPTTLDDPRVQNIIARGYIPYNTGEIKNTVITEIEAEGFNLWDEEWENGGINDTTGEKITETSQFRSKNYIKVVSGKTYYFRKNGGYLWAYAYDKDKNFIGRIVGSTTSIANTYQTIPNNCEYILFKSQNSTSPVATYNHDICINRSSSLNGQYRPYHEPSKIQLPAPVELAGVNTAKNKVIVTDDAYVFTRNQWNYTFNGNESWELYGTSFFYITLPTTARTQGAENIVGLCSNGLKVRTSQGSRTATVIRVYLSDNPQLTTESPIGSYFANGTQFYYKLATPQVISIPKKHLGVVDLGTLSWEYVSSRGFFRTTKIIPTRNDVAIHTIPNLLCTKYPTSLLLYDVEGMTDKTISKDNSYGLIKVKDTSFNGDVTAFKTAMKGQYLFFETQDEVQDFNDEMYVEAGGEVNGNLFSWNKNQLLPVQTTNTIVNGITITSNSDYKYIITVNNATGFNQIFLAQGLNIVSGHKYLVLGQDKINSTTGIEVYVSGIGSSAPAGKNYIVSATNNASICYLFVGANTPNGTYAVIPNLIDLTVGFGAGNEPTDISDYRIQRILELGYIPTDLAGTYTQETCEVLPNATLKVKCR